MTAAAFSAACAAPVGRPVSGSHIIETGTDFYRLAHAEARQDSG